MCGKLFSSSSAWPSSNVKTVVNKLVPLYPNLEATNYLATNLYLYLLSFDNTLTNLLN